MDKSSMRLTQIFINPKNDDAPSEIALSSAHPTTSKLRKKVPLATDTGLATSRHPGAFRQIRHSSFVTALEAFTTNKLLYIVLEEMKITLSHVITCSKYPDRQELRAILSQQTKNAAKPPRHPFLAMYGREENDWDKGSLLGLISLADTEADKEYHYEEQMSS
ncbi:hypothetical protein QBC46DRAFT_414583 [Diplogelasinospora grovesii]|uniref:Uncharacterized protein n=1 Tax=Diplogelasinospora grovesii TaxID=303347 RepID=A0AAN6MUE1_9PEZI|nr:hypothetical protein QBC46DRAFT_414583 [Diplogelasinospora grovesii]